MSHGYRLGDWLVWPQRDCIERGDRTVHLKPKVMAVLSRLAEAGGAVVTRDELFDAVWPGAVISDANLTQCVVELRQAFGDSAKQPKVIETVPKVGFRLIPAVVPLPDGHLPKGETAAPPPGAKGRNRLWLAIFILVLALAGYALSTLIDRRALDDDGFITLAVLPFTDISEHQDQGWLADGVSDQLISRLSQLEGLLVTSRTDSFHFKTHRESLKSMAATLGVDHVLEGSVRRDGDNMRITAQLVDARTTFNLWSEVFERPFEDIFAVQDEIAESVAVALSIRLGVGELGRNPGGTSSVAAYEEFLRAQELDREHTPEALMQALEHTRNAVEIDPEFAMGWWMMASLYVQARRDERLQGEWHSAAERAVARVREIDPTLLALRVWDHYEHLRNQRWLEAERVLFPDGRFDALGQRDMLFEKGMFLYTVGRIRDAMPLMERQRRISPLGPGTAGILAHIYLAQSRMEEALAECEHAYRVGGWVGYTVVTCVVVAMASGDRGALETWLERIVAEHPMPRHQQLFAAMAENLDDRPAALALLRDTFEETTPEAHMDFYTAIWAAWYDDTELALAVMHRSPDNFFLWLPQMKDVRQQPGFKDLVRKMKLEEYWRASSWPDFCQPLRESDFECW